MRTIRAVKRTSPGAWNGPLVKDDNALGTLESAIAHTKGPPSDSLTRQAEPLGDLGRVRRIEPIIHPEHARDASLGAAVQVIPQRLEEPLDVRFARGVGRLDRHLGLDERRQRRDERRRCVRDVPARRLALKSTVDSLPRPRCRLMADSNSPELVGVGRQVVELWWERRAEHLVLPAPEAAILGR